VLDAAGIDVATPEEVAARVTPYYTAAAVGGKPRTASSTLQSVLRGFTTIEVDYLNGEIVLLGKTFNVHTPINSVLRRMATEFAATGHGTIAVMELLRAIETER
jgi:2-dehydropantoate 2-reductase